MAETLQDYIVKLGFKVEKGEEARFNALLGNLAKTLAGIAAGLTAAAGTITASVIKVAEGFDQLHFAAQRTNASVASIKSLSYALSQVGGSSEQASAAIEGIAAAIRTNPGTGALLANIGVATRENGRLRETGALIDDIVGALSKKPYYVSQQIASVLGMPDEKAWNTFTTQWPKIREFQKEYEKRAGEFGLDPDKAATSSNKLMTSFRELMSTVDILSQKIVIELQPILTKWLEAISAWFKDHREDIVKALEGVMKAVQGLATDFGHLVNAMKPVADGFAGMVKAVGGDEGGLKWALEAVLIFMTGRWLLGMLAALGRVGGVWGAIAAVVGYGLYKSPGMLAEQAGMGQHALNPGETIANPGGANDPFNKYMEQGGWWGDFKNSKVGKFFGLGGHKDGKSSSPRTRGSSPAHGAAPAGMTQIKSKNGQTAWVASDAAPQFQGFINDLEATGYEVKDLGGFSERMIAGTNKPSQHSMGKAIDVNPTPNDIGTGTGDLPNETADLAKKWGLGWGAQWRSKNDPMHFSVAPYEGGRIMTPEELEGLEKLKGLKDKSSALMNPAPLGGSVSRSATLSQKTDITIIGSSDPAGSAASLGGAQNRIGAELIRNAQSAFA